MTNREIGRGEKRCLGGVGRHIQRKQNFQRSRADTKFSGIQSQKLDRRSRDHHLLHSTGECRTGGGYFGQGGHLRSKASQCECG